MWLSIRECGEKILAVSDKEEAPAPDDLTEKGSSSDPFRD